MAQTIEVDLGAVLERIEQKVDRLTEGQIRLEGEVKSLQIEVQNLKEENKEIKSDIKDIKSDIKGRVSIQTYWLLVLITFLIGVVGKFAFFPNP